MACSHGCVRRQLTHSKAQNSTSTTLPRSWFSCSGLEFSHSAWLECVNSGAFGAAWVAAARASVVRALRTNAGVFMVGNDARGCPRLSCPLRRLEADLAPLRFRRSEHQVRASYASQPYFYPMRVMKQSVLPLAAVALLGAGIVHAQDATEHDGHNRLRVHWSKSSETDFVTVVVGDYQQSQENNYLIGATWGHDLSDTLFGLPFPMTWHLGVQWFNEQGHQPDALGATGFVKANYRMRVR